MTKILIAEDELVSREVLKHSLELMGYEVTTTDNGDDAWAELNKDNAPKLAILDWNMPGLQGIEICKKVRKRALNNDTPYTYLILLTSKNSLNDVIEGMRAEADDYIAKPFDPCELDMRIKAGIRVLNLEEKLRGAYKQLQESEELRKEFVNSLTHDLRTPLLAEKRALTLFHNLKSNLDTDMVTIVDTMVQSNSDLLAMVNMMLETYQYEEGGILLLEEPVDIHRLIEDCFQSINALAQEREILLYNTSHKNLPYYTTDPIQLRRVLDNLVGNAVANIPEGSFIKIDADYKYDYLEISVTDNGQGISEDRLNHIFERYYSGPKIRKKIGTGLGLFICKTIVELSGGNIYAKSTVNKGTTFIIQLPMTKKQSLEKNDNKTVKEKRYEHSR